MSLDSAIPGGEKAFVPPEKTNLIRDYNEYVLLLQPYIISKLFKGRESLITGYLLPKEGEKENKFGEELRQIILDFFYDHQEINVLFMEDEEKEELAQFIIDSDTKLKQLIETIH